MAQTLYQQALDPNYNENNTQWGRKLSGNNNLTPEQIAQARKNSVPLNVAPKLTPEQIAQAKQNSEAIQQSPKFMNDPLGYAWFQGSHVPEMMAAGAAKGLRNVLSSVTGSSLAQKLQSSPLFQGSLVQQNMGNQGINKVNQNLKSFNPDYSWNLPQGEFLGGVENLSQYIPAMAAGAVFGPETIPEIALESAGQGAYGVTQDPSHPVSSFLWNAVPGLGMGLASKAIHYGSELNEAKAGTFERNARDNVKMNDADKKNQIDALNAEVDPKTSSIGATVNGLKDSIKQNTLNAKKAQIQLEQSKQPVSNAISELMTENLIRGANDQYKNEESAFTGGNKTVGEAISDAYNKAEGDVKANEKVFEQSSHNEIPNDFVDQTMNDKEIGDIRNWNVAHGVDAKTAFHVLTPEQQAHVKRVLPNDDIPKIQEEYLPSNENSPLYFNLAKSVQEALLKEKGINPEKVSPINPKASVEDIINAFPEEHKARVIKQLRKTGMLNPNIQEVLWSRMPEHLRYFVGSKTGGFGINKEAFKRAKTPHDFQQIVQNINEASRSVTRNQPFHLYRETASHITNNIVKPLMEYMDSKYGTQSAQALEKRNNIIHTVTGPFQATSLTEKLANGALNNASVTRIKNAIGKAQEELSKFKNVKGKNISAPEIPAGHFYSKIMPHLEKLSQWESTPEIKALRDGTFKGSAKDLNSALQEALTKGKISSDSFLGRAASQLKTQLEKENFAKAQAEKQYKAQKNAIDVSTLRKNLTASQKLKAALETQRKIKENYAKSKKTIINKHKLRDKVLKQTLDDAQKEHLRLAKGGAKFHERLAMNNIGKLRKAVMAAHVARGAYRMSNTGQ